MDKNLQKIIMGQ